MNVALIIAGGVGSRIGAEVPKQFIKVNGKPILLYTLEAFQSHPQIDAIELVCIDGWQEKVMLCAKSHGIDKLRWIVEGGGTAQESIRNGVYGLEGKCAPEDIVVVHDGIRPLVDPTVLDDVIETARRFGNGVTSLPYNEQIFIVAADDPATTTRYIPRETLRRVSTPQAYRFDLLNSKYHEAFDNGTGIYGSAYANTMMVDLGVRLHFAKGSDRNIKLTTPGDVNIFKAMLAEDA